MTNSIRNKVTVKMYGDQDLEHRIQKLLVEDGLKAFGSVAAGNPYTTQKGDKGWASSVTVIVPGEYNPNQKGTDAKE